MNEETRKLEFIQKFLKIENKEIVSRFEKLLKIETKDSEKILFEPM